MTVTTYDTIGSLSQLGGDLNVLPAGIGDDYNPEIPSPTGLGSIALNHNFVDLCVGPDGALFAVHCERDIRPLIGAGNTFTPNRIYAHRWNGASWDLLPGPGYMGEIDPTEGGVGPHGGPPVWLHKLHPSICSDGTSVWVTWVQYNNDSAMLGLGGEVYISKYDGSTWPNGSVWKDRTFLNGDSWLRNHVAALSPLRINVVAVGDVAYASFMFGDEQAVFVFDDSGVQSVPLPDYVELGNLNIVPAVINRAGDPVGVYLTRAGGDPDNPLEIVLFRLDTMAVLQSTPYTDIVPVGTDITESLGPNGRMILYGDDQLLVTDGAHGPLVIAEDGSTEWQVLGGSDYFVSLVGYAGIELHGALDQPVADTVDPTNLWLIGEGGTFDLALGQFPKDIYSWAPACTSEHVPPTLYNPDPPKEWRTIFPDALPSTTSYSLGPNSALVMVDDHIYVLVLEPPRTSAVRFVVYDLEICRGCAICPPTDRAIFRNRFKAEAGVEAAPTSSAVPAFDPLKGFKAE